MGIFDKLRRVFGSNQRLIDSRESQINQSITKLSEEERTPPTTSPQSDNQSLSIEKDSLQLGIAAGYTGRSLREIETSMSRIENQMVTKDWFLLTFKELLDRRFDSLQDSLDTILSLLGKVPEAVRGDIVKEVENASVKLGLRPKMIQLIDAVKESKEISYMDLAAKLSISEDALRGLLSLTVRKTSEIERFEKETKGWVRYKGQNESIQSA